MDLRTLIETKRGGGRLGASDIDLLVSGVVDGSLSDAQAGAFLMAVYLNGLSVDECAALTLAMRASGDTLHWDVAGPVVDKHSTGGVGDTVSLILAPILAACGAYVPMISGKGLGHTGGTLDKLEAIPGYTITPDANLFRATVETVGCAIVGQSANLAPADKRLYALRDETATIDNMGLIVSSILSKKLAAGLDHLVLDVKVGSGALLQGDAAVRDLAQTLVATGKAAGCPTQAVLSDMSEPLASAAGNALEVRAAVSLLKGDEVDDRLWDISVALSGRLLEASGISQAGQGEDHARDALQSGAAAERFGKMVAALGGPADFIEAMDTHLKPAPTVVEVYAQSEGFVADIDTAALGKAVVQLGGGRIKASDPIDPRVGLDWIATRGTLVDRDQPIARVHAANSDAAHAAQNAVQAAYTITDTAPTLPDLIQEWIT